MQVTPETRHAIISRLLTEFHGPPEHNGRPLDAIEDLEGDLDTYAAMFLGIDPDVWEEADVIVCRGVEYRLDS